MITYVDAIQFKVIEEIQCRFGVHKERNESDIIDFMRAKGLPFTRTVFEPNGTPEGFIYMEIPLGHEKPIRVAVGDWIVKIKNDTFISVEDEIFRTHYIKELELR